jgi:hypothetical protein
LRGKSGHRSAPDGSGIYHLHVGAAGASRLAARMIVKPRLIEPNGSIAWAAKSVTNVAQHRDELTKINAIRIHHGLGHRIGQHVQEFRFELTPVHEISLLVA